MNFKEHTIDGTRIIEILSDEIIINDEQDALDIMANIDYQLNSRRIILYKNNLNRDFFELKTGVAGNILQKFSNYKVRLAIIGDFSEYNSNSLRDFIYESNKSKLISFTADLETALESLK